MSLIPPDWAERWCDWALRGVIDGVVALIVVAAAWGICGRWLSPRLGAWLFGAVLLKCILALPVVVPVLREFRSTASSPRVLEASEGGIPSAGGDVEAFSGAEGLSPGWPQIFVVAWLVCVALGIVRLAWLVARTRRLVRGSRPASLDDAEGLFARAGFPRPVPIRVSNALHTPAVAGVWCPVVLLPEGIESRLSREQLRWAVAHELEHVRSHDLLWQFAEAVLRVVLFFNPAVWIASAQAARLRERACDEAALGTAQVSRQSSAEGFVALLEWASKHRRMAMAGLGMGASGREARSRVRHLATGRVRGPGRVWQVVFGALCLVAVVPSYRLARAQSESDRIKELEKRVSELEQQLKAKSRLEMLRERAIQRANQRARADEQRFPPEQLREIERIYQEAKKSDTGDDLGRGFQPLLDRFPMANRTGCAVLLMARVAEGKERAEFLRRAIEHHGDAFFLDGTNVGGVARLMLAQEAEAAGRTEDARRWREEIVRDYSSELDFGAVPLVDVLRAPSTSR